MYKCISECMFMGDIGCVSVSEGVRVYVYVCMYMCVCVCIYIHTCMCVCALACMCLGVYVSVMFCHEALFHWYPHLFWLLHFFHLLFSMVL